MKNQQLRYSSLLQRVNYKVVNAELHFGLAKEKNAFRGSLDYLNLPASLAQQSVEVYLYLVHFPKFRHSTKRN